MTIAQETVSVSLTSNRAVDDDPHVTELIYCLTKAYLNRFHPLPTTETGSLIFLLGLGFEKLLLVNEKYHVRGTFEGVMYENDFVHIYNDIPGELKSTRLSANKNPDQLPIGWRRQILAYMKTLGVNEYILVVLHLMGKYNPPFPILKAYRLYASQAEIDEEWDYLQFRKEEYIPFLTNKEIPTPFAYNEDWECEHCPYLLTFCKSIDGEKQYAKA